MRNEVMFEFYYLGYKFGILPESELREVTELGILTPEDFEEIVGKPFK